MYIWAMEVLGHLTRVPPHHFDDVEVLSDPSTPSLSGSDSEGHESEEEHDFEKCSECDFPGVFAAL